MKPSIPSQPCTECGNPIVVKSERPSLPLTVCSACANAATIAPFDPTATIMPVSIGHPAKYQQDSRARFDRYEDRQKIGSWEHGDIYAARHQGLDCRVTMRVLELSDTTDPDLKTQFIERVKAISGLNHPNTVQTMEAGIDESVAFIVQPQFEAKPIEGFLPRGFRERSAEAFFPNPELNMTMRSVVAALKAIHEQGIVHGNIDSQSIVVCPSGVVRLTGLIEPQTTNAFLPPEEVCLPESIRADIMQLGRAFYHITTDTHPEQHLCNQTAKRISAKLKKKNRGLQKSIRDVIARCITFGESSYQDCEEILSDLARASEQVTLQAPWRSRIYSLVCEFAGLAIILPGVFFIGFGGPKAGTYGGLIILLAYPILMETIFGFTIARRLFGLKLCDHSGDVAYWTRRFFRSLLRIILLLGAIMIPLMIISLFTGQTLLPVILLMVVMPLLIYATALFSKSRWTIYDLVAGANWAEHFEDKLLATAKKQHSGLRKQRVTSEPIDRVDQYEILELLGSGGMGNVYLAHDPTINRDVAVKVLSDDLVNEAGVYGRFQSEARLVAKINHPNVARVYGIGVWKESPFIAMEYIEGEDLQNIVQSVGPKDVGAAWRWITQAAHGLKAVSQLDVVHRDVKPANLMLAADGTIKVLDFGISRDSSVESDLTQLGAVIGTPTYMAPEQAKGEQADARSDIYSLGLSLYFLLTGTPPFAGNSQIAILAQKMESSPPSLFGTVPGLTREQSDVLDRMIAISPANRYQDYESLIVDLEVLNSENVSLAQPAKRLAAEFLNLFAYSLATAVVQVGIVAFVLSKNDPEIPIQETAVREVPAQLADGSWTQFVFLVVWLCFFCVYLFGIAWQGKTSGKKLMRLKVIRDGGELIGLSRSFLRMFIAMPFFFTLPLQTLETAANPWVSPLTQFILVINLIMAIISVVSVFRTPKRQALHDLATGTIVVRN